MNVSLQQGIIQSIAPLPCYGGQSFEWMAEGTVERFSGEEGQSDCSLFGGTIQNPFAVFAGDDFEGTINLQSFLYNGLLITGYFGADQAKFGGASLGLGYTFEKPPP